MNRGVPIVLVILIGWGFGYGIGARLFMKPRLDALRESVQTAESSVQPAVRAELPPAREEVVAAPPQVEQPQQPPLAAAAPLARLNVPWAELERTLLDSTLVRSPAELDELAAAVEDVWAVLCAEREFDARAREILREQPPPSAPWAERKHWHDSRWKPWVEQNLLLFVDQLYRFRVPAAVVDRYRNRKLDQL